MEEIEKLRLRVEKDPNSRLFLPLAEEYRKSGMFDEAISVILRGLEHQPGYTSARVALGRIYLEKEMIDEAQKEFEGVVSAIPDNLFAHRKLADIYRERGEFGKAVSEYKTVIRLNPLDEEAKMCLSEIENAGLQDEPAELAEFGPAEVPEVSDAGDLPGTDEEPLIMEEVTAAPEPEPEPIDEDFEAFRASFSTPEPEEVASAGEAAEVSEEQLFEMPDEASFDDILTESPVVSEEAPELPRAAVSAHEPGVRREAAELSVAEGHIAKGNYYKALETYREMLTDDPQNRQVLQRVAELKTLMKLLGKGNEVLIAKLQSFLDAVQRGFPKGS